ncbi:MAG: glycosyltransferase family 1 protein [Candidatus Hydrogenedentota bacterium]|nr:MAG: glycosyltransferase family 1 protein [Candidatus Hydrogenedentota bacterium]
MKILMLWEYYPDFLAHTYRSHPELKTYPYKEQREVLLNSHFGWPGEVCSSLRRLGMDVEFVIANAVSLQTRWFEEHRPRNTLESSSAQEVVAHQIKAFRPDIVFCPALPRYSGRFFDELRPYYRHVVLWIGYEIPPRYEFRNCSAVCTSWPFLAKRFDPELRDVFHVKAGFDPNVLNEIGIIEKTRSITFVGSLSESHKRRAEYLSTLIEEGVEVECFGKIDWHSSDVRLRKSFEVIQPCHRGAVYGLEMYRILASSFVTINVHSEAAGALAGNMRLFEATGVGACLVTEDAINIADFYVPNQEVVTYTSLENFVEVVRELAADKEKALAVGRRGQKRTLREHTTERMARRISSVFERVMKEGPKK